MSWTPEIVRALIVEACDTISRLPAVGISTKSGLWPEYMHTFEDMAGWGAKRLAEEREMRARRAHATPDAISRLSQVERWNAQIIAEEDRKYIWAWAWCRLRRESFTTRCSEEKWSKGDAYTAITSAINLLVVRFRQKGAPLILPADRFLLLEMPKSGTHVGTMGLVDVEPPPKSPTAVIDERARDLLTTAHAITMFGEFLSKTNSQRRAKRERKAKRRAEA